MSNSGPARLLKLQIEIIGQVVHFEIRSNETFLIGSDPACNLHLSGDGIAPRHLSLYFQHETVEIRDLESVEGTYRLPQGAPFVEYKSAEDSSIELKLGQTPVKFTWKIAAAVEAPKSPASPSAYSESPTRVAGNLPAPSIARAESAPKKPARKAPLAPRPTETPAPIRAPQKAGPVEMSVETRLRAFENLSLLFFLAALFRVLTELREKLSEWQLWAIPDYYRRGVALDCLYLYWREPFFWRTLLLGGIGLVLFLFFIKPLSRMLGNRFGHLLPTRTLLVFSGLRGSRWIGALFSLLLLIWTPFLAVNLGFQTSDLPFFRKISEHLQKNPKKYFDFESVPKIYRGSSLLYKVWVLSEREELVDRCRSFGTDSWAGQKQCLILFFSKTLEGYARFQPRISQHLAASQVLVASLDGLIRIFSIEGPQSPAVGVFLDPLETVGLGDDRKRFVDFIASFEGLEFDALTRGLVEMKHRLEEQSEHDAAMLPAALRVRFPGPVELGI